MHGYFFGLFEAMSAIEIMDPKMDAGMMCNRESKAIKVNLYLYEIIICNYYIYYLYVIYSLIC